MNRPEELFGQNDRLLINLGGRYILRIHIYSQIISSIIGPLVGLYFVYLSAGLTSAQFIQLILSMLLFILLVNALHYVFIIFVTNQSRLLLDNKIKNKPLPEGHNAVSAWKEIVALPRRSAFIQVILLYGFIILPVCLYMRIMNGATGNQVLLICIGGSISVLTVLTQSVLYLDAQLAPARRALLPAEASQQVIQRGIGQKTRLYFVTLFLLLAAFLTIGALSYFNIRSIAFSHANPVIALDQFQIQFLIQGIILVALGLFLTSLLVQSTLRPTQEIKHVLDLVKKGHYAERARIFAADETAPVIIEMNQVLDELQLAQKSLDRQAQERTTSLEFRSIQLHAVAQLAREAATFHDLDSLFSRTVDLISDRFSFYHTGIFLLDETGEYAILRAASSEGGKSMLARGYRLEIGHQGIIGTAVYQNRTRIVMDVSTDSSFLNTPDLPLTRSEAAIPLTVQNKVIGILDLHSSEPSAFTNENIDLFQTMADQIALAIQNTQLVNDIQALSRQMETVNAENVHISWMERSRQQNRAFQYSSGSVSPVLPTDEDVKDLPQSIEPDHSPERMNIPITLRGQKIGKIIMHRKGEAEWGEAERSLAAEVANQIGLALENARLLEETQRRAAQEQSLNDLTAQLSRSLDPDTILQTTVRELYQLPHISEVSVYLTPPKSSPEDSSQASSLNQKTGSDLSG